MSSSNTFPAPASLTPEQARGWDIVMNEGKSICISGRAGCGKSFLVRKLIKALRKQLGRKHVFITASTGIAACNIGGTTLHSFAGIGLGKGTVHDLLKRVKQSRQAPKRWRAARVLVIDEISMVDGILLQCLDVIARNMRDEPAKPFGGIRLIMVGDFFQLPPVATDGTSQVFAFEAPCWKQLIQPQSIVDLRVQMRQQDDEELALALNKIRVGIVEPEMAPMFARGGSKLAELEEQGIKPTKLYAHNYKVNNVNNFNLKKLEGKMYTFKAKDSGTEAGRRQLEHSCRVPTIVDLKIGAQVMLLRNIDQKNGLVNGVQGRVVDMIPASDHCDEVLPMVRFFTMQHGEVVRVVEPAEWEVVSGDTVLARRLQIPLRLAYAITIHKSQGMTIDALQVNLHGIFEAGQAYVALSRAVSLDRLKVTKFDESMVRCNKRVLRFYYEAVLAKKRLAAAAAAAEETEATKRARPAAGTNDDVPSCGPTKRPRRVEV